MYVRPHQPRNQDASSVPRALLRATWALRVLLALLLVPALFAGGGARSAALLRCELTQLTHASCCCPTVPRSSEASLSRSCCCTRVEVASGLPTGSVRADSQQLAPALLAVAPSFGRGLSPPRVIARAAEPALAQPALARETRSGPPLFVLHRRYLI